MSATALDPRSATDAPVALLEVTADGRIAAVNACLEALTGRAAEDLVGRRLHELLSVGARVFYETHCKPILVSRGEVAEVALELRGPGRARLPVLLYARRDADGSTRMAFVTAFERRLHDDELRRMRERERARHDLQALTAGLSEQALRGVEPAGLYALAAEGLGALLPADLVTITEGTTLRAALGPDLGDLLDDLPPSLAESDAFRAAARLRGEPVLHEAGVPPGAGRFVDEAAVVSVTVPVGAPHEPHGLLAVHRAGTERLNAFEVGAVQAVASLLWTAVLRHRDEQAVAHRAAHDALTGLPNRELLLDRLEQELARARRGVPAPAVLFLDLDDFKLVNDSLGHHAGDRLLQTVAGRLVDAVREVDTVARLGGDEFVVLCPEVGTTEHGELLARRVQEVLGTAVDLGGHRAYVRGSVGLVVARPDATPAQLLGDADAAMYRAKATGRGRHVVFDEGMRESAARRLRVEAELHDAIGEGQLRCHLQPIVELEDGRPVGLEALVRWQHPSRGLLPPSEFIVVAQQCGLMDALGAEVLRQACGALTHLRASVPRARELHLTVNVSVSQLSAGFVALVEGVLRDTGLLGEPGVLRLEVTESLFADRDDVTAEVLEGLRALGVTVLIDDFGTGFSSLSRLRALPIDGLKIDRSFVAALGEDGEGDGALITAILDLATALELDVVCEGVETESQRRRLRAMGGGRAQGHLFARALAPADLEAWLRAAA